MDADTWLAGIGGALKGGLDVYSWQKEQQQQEELSMAKLRVQQLLGELAARSRETVASTNAASRERIAGDRNFMEGYKWRTPSANVTLQQTSAGQRNDATIAGAGQRNDATIKGAAERNAATIAGAYSRHRTASGNARLGAETARRGQDLDYSLGTDRNILTGRGQDLDYEVGMENEAGRNTRGRRGLYDNIFDEPGSAPGPTISKPTPPKPARPAPKPFTPSPLPSGTTPGGSGGTGARGAGRGSGTNARAGELQRAVVTKLAQLKAAQDPKTRAVLEAELSALHAQIVALQRGGGQ